MAYDHHVITTATFGLRHQSRHRAKATITDRGQVLVMASLVILVLEAPDIPLSTAPHPSVDSRDIRA